MLEVSGADIWILGDESRILAMINLSGEDKASAKVRSVQIIYFCVDSSVSLAELSMPQAGRT